MNALSVSVIDACRLLGIGRTKLYELISSQEIQSFSIGRRRLVKVASLQALIEGGRR